MNIYFPVAEMTMNGLIPIFLGLVVGFMAGLFGIGGGFIMTPLLIFTGVPPAVAVGTQANQIIAASVSGAWSQWRKRKVDFKMGGYLVAGGVAGSLIGTGIFSVLQMVGQIDIVISFSYILLLGGIAVYMIWEVAGARSPIRERPRYRRGRGQLRRLSWIRGLPYKTRFPASRLYISSLVPAGLGFCIGLLVAIMGIGGGFIMLPAMIYLLGMPTAMVPGTNLMQITVISAFTTFLHAVQNHTVDVLLAFILLIGSVIGAQIGTRTSMRLKSEQLRLLLSAVVLLLCAKLCFDLTIPPDSIFNVILIREG